MSIERKVMPDSERDVKRWDGVAISAGIAQVLAWVATLFMAFGPIYQGVSTTATTPGGVAETVRTSATLLEANGLSALPLLLTPVALTAFAATIALTARIKPSTRRVYLWVAAVLLLLFCAAGIFSIGIFYFPAAVALVVAAVIGSRRTPVGAR